MIAALYVQHGGVYYGLPDVITYGLPERDARDYDGPHPVVAHPPCARWCRLAGLVQHRWGHERGNDGGCFAHALSAVLRFGGVLEHPAWSDAWIAYGLEEPPTSGGWVPCRYGGWTCCVSQKNYGHRARKMTWLFAHRTALPELRWGQTSSDVWISWCANNGGPKGAVVERMGKNERNRTPVEFRDLLLSIAKSTT